MIKDSIEDGDVYWKMDWSIRKPNGDRVFPDKPETTMEFEPQYALVHLIINEVIIVNNFWWMKDWPIEAQKAISLAVNCSDIFMYVCADAENMEYTEIEDVYDHWVKDPMYGTAVWCCKKRNQLPMREILNTIEKMGIWDMKGIGNENI